MSREYKGELFRKFALKLKKEHLWHKFFVLEYYFRFYTNPNNSTARLIEFYKNKNDDAILLKEWFKNSKETHCDGTFFENTDCDIKLSEFYKHYKL